MKLIKFFSIIYVIIYHFILQIAIIVNSLQKNYLYYIFFLGNAKENKKRTSPKPVLFICRPVVQTQPNITAKLRLLHR